MKNKTAYIIEITSISYGTLGTCCRQSNIFNSNTTSYEHLDVVKSQWVRFLEQSSVTFHSWVDAWLAFVYDKQAQINKQTRLIDQSTKSHTNKDGYSVYKYEYP
jgi:hypothetical protein